MNTLASFIENFHFIRPLWLLALPAGLALLYGLSRTLLQKNGWQQVIDQQLLSHLINQQEQQQGRRGLMWAVMLGWCIACIASAGPAWQQLKQPVVKKQDALVLILDLSLSMYAEDQKPSRLVQAKRKLNDILKQRKEGLTALIVYSGDAHVVAPLTDDVDTIMTMVPALEPSIMPKFGSNLPAAITEALQLLSHNQLQQAQILLLTDEVSDKHLKQSRNQLPHKVDLAILTFGTEDGAPIPLPQGFLKDSSGNTVIARLNWGSLSRNADSLGIPIRQSVFDDSDINSLLRNPSIATNDQIQSNERQFDLWQDNGHWLSLLLLPLILLAFRRGWIVCLLILVLPEPSHALEWQDLWKTPDQQAAEAYQQGDTAKAAKTFKDPLWQASSAYANGDYEKALEGFSTSDSADALYNKGNTLARMGKLEEALQSYQQALEKQPDLKDAKDNQALVEQLLQQQKQAEKNQQQSDKNQQGDSDSQEANQEPSSQQEQEQQQNQQQGQNSEQQQQDANTQQSSQQQQNPDSDTQKEQASASAEQQQDPPDNENVQNKPEESEEKLSDQDQQATASQQQEQTDSANENDKSLPAPEELTPLQQEQQQALQQWLRQIPDDPGMLLKNKFQHQYQVNRKNNEHIDKDSDKVW